MINIIKFGKIYLVNFNGKKVKKLAAMYLLLLTKRDFFSLLPKVFEKLYMIAQSFSII